MACGCPVVGTNVGCMTELGVDGENVLLNEPGDVSNLAKNIKKVIEDAELRKILSENGAKTVAKLSWGKSAKKFLNIMEG